MAAPTNGHRGPFDLALQANVRNASEEAARRGKLPPNRGESLASGLRLTQPRPPVGWRALAHRTARARGRLRDGRLRDRRLFDLCRGCYFLDNRLVSPQRRLLGSRTRAP